jgi:hypothetical protein
MDLVPLVSTPDNKLGSLMSNVNNNRSEQVLINALAMIDRLLARSRLERSRSAADASRACR